MRAQYSDSISVHYNYRFGKDQPFAPSNALIEGGEFIQPGAFPSAQYCGHCHGAAYAQWQQSLHRNSFREPFYIKNVNLLDDTKGIEYSRHCEGCHNPVALFSGVVTQNSHIERTRMDDEGVSCSVCHSIEKLQPMSGNGAYVMGVPAAIVDAQGNPVPGEVPFSEIMAYPDRHRKAVMKDFYRSAEFCGSCHKSTIPHELNDYKWVRGFGTYDEWQASALSNRNPVPFYQRALTTCQGCHMASESAAVPQSGTEYGAKNGLLASHRWLGGNTAVPFYYGFKDQLSKSIAFLQNQTLNVDIFALKRPDSGELVAPLGIVPATLHVGERVQAFVVIQNKGLGHSLIPEQRDFYEAWTEFVVTDATGREIAHSGFLNPDGTLEETAHSFTSRLVAADGRGLAQHQIWLRRAVAYDNTILPGRSALIRYEFQVPEEVKGPITISARVNYRHFMQQYLDYTLGASHPPYPIVEMASVSRRVATRSEDTVATEPSPAPNLESPEWLRWNNFGVALVDQGQYREALAAFQHVVALRSDYADGYTNIALAQLSLEDYVAAKNAADHSLQVAPYNPRALYFRAITERNMEGGLASAVADLEKVVAKFPDSRDALRGLALSYYLAHNDAGATRTYQALQANDPDDVLCHFYLSVLFRRAGLNEMADAQAALYNEKRDDQGAPNRALMFLRQSPNANMESNPAHVHFGVKPNRSIGLER